MSKYILILSMLLSLNFILFSCAGTDEYDDEYAGMTEEEKKQQQELDEIESLLGITSPEGETTPKKEKKPENDDSKLDLLNSEDLAAAAGQQNDTKKVKDLEKEIKNLKSEINRKDLTISDLQAQAQLQEQRITQMSSSQPEYGYSSGTISVGDVSPAEYESSYQEGYNLFNAREYQSAVQVFESLIASNANHKLADNAQYWIGECHYAQRNYDKAIIDFEKVFTFTNSNKADDAQFKLGLCYVRKGDNQKAREEFQRLITVYPKSEYVSRAQKHLK